MIRAAAPTDVSAILKLAMRFHAISPWSGIALDEGAVVDFVANLLGSEQAIVLVSEKDGVVVGMAGAIVAPVFFARAHIAQEAFWYCESARDSRDLMAGLEEWARERGALALTVARLSGLRDGALDALYRRAGFEPHEHFYTKVF